MSMFSFFRKSTNISNTEAVSPKEQVIPDVDSDDGRERFDSVVEVSGGKGWQTCATVLLYHKKQGLICVGTEGGTIYVYGDGFQYMRPWLTEEANEVVSIVALHPNRILAAFADNSFVILELPTLEVIDLLQAVNWMNPRWGDITAIHCDMPSEKNFVFVGTSEGFVTVLDVMESSVRICDFELSPSDFGLSGQNYSVCDIQSSPRDERFVAIGFEGVKESNGAVALYDLVKRKLVKVFFCNGVTSMQWHHSGDALYAGTRTGQVMFINFDKGVCNVAWDGREEKIDDDESDLNSAMFIRRVGWLAPQDDSDGGEGGCLFALLSTGAADNDNLKNVVIGLGTGSSLSDLQVIFALPPIPYSKVISFRLVPTYNKDLKPANSSGEDCERTPGLLLLVQQQLDINFGHVERYLYLMRCPTSAIKDWALEMGTLEDPRKAREVQPAASDITTSVGLVPDIKNPLSLGKALLSGAIEEEQVVTTTLTQKAPAPSTVEEAFVPPEDNKRKRMSKRLSARQFYENQINLHELEDQLQESDKWEMVLSPGEHEEHTDGVIRQQDVVFNGHADGTIIAYGVSMPDNRPEFGKASIWLPLTAVRCGTTSVTAIAFDETSGLLLSGDEEGFVVLHEIYETRTNVGVIDILKKINEQAFLDAEDAVGSEKASSVPTKRINDFSPIKFLQDCSLYDYNHFNSLREVYRTKFPSQEITTVAVYGSLMILFVGTADGSVFVATDLRSPMFAKVNKLDSTGANGAVRGFDFGYYPHRGNLLCVVYVLFESGHVVAIDISIMSPVGFIVAFGASKVAQGSDCLLHSISHLSVLNAAFQLLPKPTLAAYAYITAKMKLLSRDRSSGSFDSAVSDSSVPQPNSPLVRSQSTPINQPSAITPPPANNAPPKRSFFGSIRSSNSASSPVPAASTGSGGISPVPSQDRAFSEEMKVLEFTEIETPKYLVFVFGKTISTIALQKFLPIQNQTSLSSAATALSGVQTSDLCKRTILATQLYFLPDKSSDDIAVSPRATTIKRTAYLACVDDEGLVRVVSFKSRSPVHHASTLEGVTAIQCNGDEEDSSQSTLLLTGCLLANGSCYLVGKGVMQYSATIVFNDDELDSMTKQLNLLGLPLPERAIPTSKELNKDLVLLHGREQTLQNLKNQLKKRRSSVISLSAAPTDLYKVFQKTREQRSREELFGKDDSSGKESETYKANVSAGKVKNELDELKEGFTERGERINRIAMKMDDFKQNALAYREKVREQKATLQKRNTRWGLF